MNLERILTRIVSDIEPEIGRGEVPGYIPPLATIDPNQFGIAVHTIDGNLFTAGSAYTRFSIQSISKIYSLALAFKLLDDEIWTRLYRGPVGTSFNSLVQLEVENGKPRNPFISPGALVVVDILASHFERPEMAVLQFIRRLAGNASIDIEFMLAHSEQVACDRNIAMAYFMKSFGNLRNSVEDVIRSYCHQCSIMMSCAELASAGAFLSNAGVCTSTGSKLITSNHVKQINALMTMCGTYDSAGDFTIRIGLPAMSGVGGGILAVVPGHATICVWSPGLDVSGNSHAGGIALERLADMTGWSIF